jgi:hypothetical protein
VNKKQKIALIITIVLFVGSAGTLAFLNYQNNQESISKEEKNNQEPSKPPEPPKPVLKEAQLDGQLIEGDLYNRHPLAIMIENHPQARPQAGLTDASIVYETLAEGGITRFMAVYSHKIPAKAGPVRSARTYYVDWAQEYDAFYAHVGGAQDALNKISADNVKDLNQFAIGTAAFWREPKAGIAIEHTMFTDPAKLYNIAWQKNWPKSSNFTTYGFKEDAATTERPSGGTISIDFSGNSYYAVKYTYDPVSNNYLRNMAGNPHRDRVTGTQINPKNIIVQYANEITKAGKKDHDTQTIGSGPAKIFLDGKMIEGTWKKTARGQRTIFLDGAGAQIKINRGQTFIEVVRPNAPVIFTPPA